MLDDFYRILFDGKIATAFQPPFSLIKLKKISCWDSDLSLGKSYRPRLQKKWDHGRAQAPGYENLSSNAC